LCATTKYKFVIESIERHPTDAKILEIGCSRGYLTSYFILAGYNVTGVDISAEAVAGAQESFGDFFLTADSPAVADRAPYDVIYHVGTIGCVGDPLKLTRQLLGMLKPGGELIFNAPNADSCWLKDQLWIDAAPPPDLVTLFRPGFWSQQFAGVATVKEEIEPCPPERSFGIGVSKLFGRKWRRPEPLLLEASLNDFKMARRGSAVIGDRLWPIFERSAVKAGRLTRTLALAPTQPSPFGLLIRMTKV
jgi:SAM-dependent methyltransferase